ncbi:hypothetical protein LOAG_09832, partial [Loa loa]
NRMQCPVCRKHVTAKDLVTLLSFRIVKDNSNMKSNYESRLQMMVSVFFEFIWP